MSKDFSAQLDNIHAKINLLAENYKLMREKLDDLKAENQKLQNLLNGKNAEILKLEEQIKILKMAKSFFSGNSQELKEKIDEYIKEIDLCLKSIS